MLVRRLRADFDRPDPVLPVSWDHRSARILVDARFVPVPALDGFDPRTGPITLTVGPAYLGGFAGSRTSVRGRRFAIRSRPWNRRHGSRIRIDLKRGHLRAEIRDADAGGLVAEGPTGCVVALSIGGVTYIDTVNTVAEDLRWRYTAARQPVPAPPGDSPAPSAGEALAFRPLASGEFGGSPLPRGFVVATSEDLERVWAHRVRDDPAPDVDFALESVLFLDIGRRPSAGLRPRIEVTRVTSGECGPGVEFTEFDPSAGAAVETHPWTAVVLPRVSGTVTLVGTVVAE